MPPPASGRSCATLRQSTAVSYGRFSGPKRRAPAGDGNTVRRGGGRGRAAPRSASARGSGWPHSDAAKRFNELGDKLRKSVRVLAIGTLAGGPVGDRIGRKYVIWDSILGVLPFTLILPYANLFSTGVLSVLVGLILASAFSAILVYAQDLVHGRVGTISGVFFGLAFGLGGVGAAVLGQLADWTSIDSVYRVCAFLPAIGLLAGVYWE